MICHRRRRASSSLQDMPADGSVHQQSRHVLGLTANTCGAEHFATFYISAPMSVSLAEGRCCSNCAHAMAKLPAFSRITSRKFR